MRRIVLFFISYFLFSLIEAQTSIAGLFPLEDSGRQVWNFNAGWRFHLGDVAGAEAGDFDDKSWEDVSTPHSVLLMPAEASGCRNYQGIVWYRKHFRLPKECEGCDVTLHFEAIMGKQTIYVNGKKMKEHEGGYLPITIPLSGFTVGDDLVVAIKADNSDDKTYPPGKKQAQLDFAYHGGIYRDVWLIAKNKVAITDAIEETKWLVGAFLSTMPTSARRVLKFSLILRCETATVRREASLLKTSSPRLKVLWVEVLPPPN